MPKKLATSIYEHCNHVIVTVAGNCIALKNTKVQNARRLYAPVLLTLHDTVQIFSELQQLLRMHRQ
jgi:hypothetical protein